MESPDKPSQPKRRRPNGGLAFVFVVALVVIAATSTVAWRSQDVDHGFAASAAENDRVPPTTATSSTTTTSTTMAVASELPPVLRSPNPAAPLDVWFLGDSTAYAIGNQLDALDAEGLLHVELRYTTSSGLARPDFYDWQMAVQWIQDNTPPEAMIFSLGANDPQPMTDPAGNVHTDVYSDGWLAEYERRVEELTLRVIGKNTRMYWVGQPVARSPEFSVFVDRINSVMRAVAERYDEVEFIDVYDLFTDGAGGYVDDIVWPDGQPHRVRRPDGIHLTLDGGAVAAPAVMQTLRTDWGG
jgi:hypothetical protein